MSTISKVLEMLLLEEINCSFKPSELQFGFICHRGTREASLLVQEAAQHCISRKVPLFAANLDARKCFDRLWQAGVLLRASDHLSLRSWALLAFWYGQLNYCASPFQRGAVRRFRCAPWGEAGGLLSPCLTNIFLLPLMQQLDVSSLGLW